MSVHYALCDIAACGEDIMGECQHTTLQTSVTCEECQDVLKKKKRLKEYMKEVEEILEQDSEDYD